MRLIIASYTHKYSDGMSKQIEMSIHTDFIAVDVGFRGDHTSSYAGKTIDDALQIVREKHGDAAYEQMKEEVGYHEVCDDTINKIEMFIGRLEQFKKGEL